VKVSIIMTSYNKPHFVGKALRAALNQSMGDLELLLMDDNSDAETQRVIRPFLSDPRVRFYRSGVKSVEERAQKTRYSVLINQAIRLSRGEYITYLTDDNIYHPNRLERMSNYLDERPDVQIVYSSSVTRYVDDNGRIVRTVERPATQVTRMAPCIVDHCSVMHRRSILPEVYRRFGAFWDEDPRYYRIGDARFFWRLNQLWPFHPLPEVLDYNYITTVSLHQQMFSEEKSALIRMLPPQKTCQELRESLAALIGHGK
jgi:glycosyltransferase involved in cell wall biosynthesis